MSSYENDPVGLDSTAKYERNLSSAVVRAVADSAGQEATDLPPLGDIIDPDALDTLFETTRHGDSRQGVVTFQYAGHHVQVTGAGEITVEPLSGRG